MSNSLKIFRPWDVHQDLCKCEEKNDIAEITHQLMEDSSHMEGNSNYLLNKKSRLKEEGVESDSRNSNDESKPYSEMRAKIIPSENENQISKRNSHCDQKIEEYIIDNRRKCTNNTSDSQSNKHLENSFQYSHATTESSHKTKHDRRHSRKLKKSLPEKIPETHSSLSSPSNTLDSTTLSADLLYQTDVNFRNFEKNFYPDFRSLEFLPEDILDPILMAGLPLGAPLDPYWSNLALEYFKNQEANIKNKQARPKKFNCPYCNVAFSNNGQLKGHIRIHTGERPFKCDADGCGKSFTRNEELTRHKRIHSGLRPYPCSHCGKKFGRKDHLKKHLRTHFPQPRFVPLYSPYMYGGYGTVIL